MDIVRKGQIDGIGKGVVEEQVRFVESIFKVAAYTSFQMNKDCLATERTEWAEGIDDFSVFSVFSVAIHPFSLGAYQSTTDPSSGS
jgi:hypothetical protein